MTTDNNTTTKVRVKELVPGMLIKNAWQVSEGVHVHWNGGGSNTTTSPITQATYNKAANTMLGYYNGPPVSNNSAQPMTIPASSIHTGSLSTITPHAQRLMVIHPNVNNGATVQPQAGNHPYVGYRMSDFSSKVMGDILMVVSIQKATKGSGYTLTVLDEERTHTIQNVRANKKVELISHD